mgnify:FL=1
MVKEAGILDAVNGMLILDYEPFGFNSCTEKELMKTLDMPLDYTYFLTVNHCFYSSLFIVLLQSDSRMFSKPAGKINNLHVKPFEDDPLDKELENLISFFEFLQEVKFASQWRSFNGSNRQIKSNFQFKSCFWSSRAESVH